MILFVIFIHENPTAEKNGEVVMWWHSVVVVAVPVFFTLSGYFFFQDVEKLTMEKYKEKIRRRVQSLLIPYLIWNCIPAVFFCAGNLYSIIFRHKSSADMTDFLYGLWNDGLWHIWWDKTSGMMPFDSPLWYVRDLIILCILSPVIYWLIQKSGWLLVLILGLLYFMQVSFPIGFSLTGLLFFSFGASFALKGLNLNMLGKGKYIVYFLTICLFALCNTFDMIILHPLFIMSSCYSWILLFHDIQGKATTHTARFSESVFFVLALHNIIVLANVGKLLDKLFVGDFHYICYWIAPPITLFVCILLYYGTKKVSPQTIRVLCGGR